MGAHRNIESTLSELHSRMREVVCVAVQLRMIHAMGRESVRRSEDQSPEEPILYELYYNRKETSPELYEFCLDQGHADHNLIAKWKKPGYERVCCLHCILTRDHNFATTCVSVFIVDARAAPVGIDDNKLMHYTR